QRERRGYLARLGAVRASPLASGRTRRCVRLHLGPRRAPPIRLASDPRRCGRELYSNNGDREIQPPGHISPRVTGRRTVAALRPLVQTTTGRPERKIRAVPGAARAPEAIAGCRRYGSK